MLVVEEEGIKPFFDSMIIEGIMFESKVISYRMLIRDKVETQS